MLVGVNPYLAHFFLDEFSLSLIAIASDEMSEFLT